MCHTAGRIMNTLLPCLRALVRKNNRAQRHSKLLKKQDFYTMILIDTHCHLYLEEFKTDLDAVIERARQQGVSKFYLPAIDTVYSDLQLAADGSKIPASAPQQPFQDNVIGLSSGIKVDDLWYRYSVSCLAACCYKNPF